MNSVAPICCPATRDGTNLNLPEDMAAGEIGAAVEALLPVGLIDSVASGARCCGVGDLAVQPTVAEINLAHLFDDQGFVHARAFGNQFPQGLASDGQAFDLSLELLHLRFGATDGRLSVIGGL